MGDYNDKDGKMMTPAEAMSRAANEAMEREGPQTPEQMLPRSLNRIERELTKVENAFAEAQHTLTKAATERVDDAMNKRRMPTPEGSLGHALAEAMEAKQKHMREVPRKKHEAEKAALAEADRRFGKNTVFGGTEPVKESEAPVQSVAEFLNRNAEFAQLEFRPGDLVMLKSGGSVMTIEACKKLTDDEKNGGIFGSAYAAWCAWFSEDQSMNSKFSFDALQLVKKGPYHD